LFGAFLGLLCEALDFSKMSCHCKVGKLKMHVLWCILWSRCEQACFEQCKHLEFLCLVSMHHILVCFVGIVCSACVEVEWSRSCKFVQAMRCSILSCLGVSCLEKFRCHIPEGCSEYSAHAARCQATKGSATVSLETTYLALHVTCLVVVARVFSHTGQCMTVMHVRALSALMCEQLLFSSPRLTRPLVQSIGRRRQAH
jgi:hypothetical protein